jgi:hypothetical protein
MKKFSIVFVAALALGGVGCKSGSDCKAAIAHSMEFAKADMAKRGADDKMIEKLKALGVQHCTDDKWSADVLKCMTDAKTEMEAQACYGKMPVEQQKKMNDAMMQAMTPPAGAGTPVAGSAAAAPAGSAAK